VTPVKAGVVFATVMVAVFVSNLDLFVVNVALPRIGQDFHGASLDALSWVLNAYAIVFAALLVVAGRLADRRGHRPGFLFGLGVFTLGSTLCALATGTGWLVAFRVLQAAGAAVLLPTSLALLLATAAPERRARVVRAWSAVGGVAAGLGPVVGGLLVQASWRWVFLINVPIGLAAMVIGSRVLPEVRREERGPFPDLLGAAMLTVSVGALALSLVEGNSWGWSDRRTIGGFVAAAALLGLFLFQSARHPAPVVELPMLRIKAFSSATVATMLFTVGLAGMILSAVLWCESVWGYSALKTGLALAPGPLMVPPLAAAAGPLGRRFGPGPVSAAGNLLFGVGLLWWGLRTGLSPHYATQMLPGFLIGGVGIGLALPTLTAAGATALPPQRFATGSGILNMARQIGAVLGVAVVVVILGRPKSPVTALNHFQHGWEAIAGATVLAALASLLVRTQAPASGAAPRTDSVPQGQQVGASRE